MEPALFHNLADLEIYDDWFSDVRDCFPSLISVTLSLLSCQNMLFVSKNPSKIIINNSCHLMHLKNVESLSCYDIPLSNLTIGE
jgi:hypothetical protein